MNYLLVIFIKLLSYFPLYILRLFSKFFYIINLLFIRYRFKVVYNNLKLVFPKKNHNELKELRYLFFKYFFNLIIEIIKMITVKRSFINNRVHIKNPELLSNMINDNNNVILLSSHYNNWEWMGAKISMYYNKYPFIAIYKQLSSAIFNNLFIKSRERFGGKVINMEESIRYLLATKKKKKIIGIISDQNPVVNDVTEWLPFFNKEVPVFFGAELLSKKINCPVVFCNMQYVGNNNYSITFEVISTEPKKTKKGEITKCYLKLLEKQIKKEPSQWLWSHRRWRHRK